MKSKAVYRFFFIVVVIIILLIYGYFSFYSSYNFLNIKSRYDYFGWEGQNVSGFYEEEKLENSYIHEYSWTVERAVKKVIVEGDVMIIPIFCLKPDINSEYIKVKIFLDESQIHYIYLKDNNLRYLRCNMNDQGYKIGDVIYVSFEVDSLWRPSDYGMEDGRYLGIAVGRVKFIN